MSFANVNRAGERLGGLLATSTNSRCGSAMFAFGGKADMRRLSAVVGDARRKRIEADIITGPTWPL
jgi:hypothetical protein